LAVYRPLHDAFAEPRHEAQLPRADVPWLAVAIGMGSVAGPVLLLLGLSRTSASVVSLLLNVEGGSPFPPCDHGRAAGFVGPLGVGLSLAMFILALRYLGSARTGAFSAASPCRHFSIV
jgi:drug/metabolite transporter (DMT)-like permease